MTDNDRRALALLRSGALLVDDAGAIWRHGRRAEELNTRTGYGMVRVTFNPIRRAMAHRVVWLSIHETIPDGLEVNHRNLRRWDNRPENLELVTSGGNSRHARGQDYRAAHCSDLAVAARVVEDDAPPPLNLRPAGQSTWHIANVRTRR